MLLYIKKDNVYINTNYVTNVKIFKKTERRNGADVYVWDVSIAMVDKEYAYERFDTEEEAKAYIETTLNSMVM